MKQELFDFSKILNKRKNSPYYPRIADDILKKNWIPLVQFISMVQSGAEKLAQQNNWLIVPCILNIKIKLHQ